MATNLHPVGHEGLARLVSGDTLYYQSGRGPHRIKAQVTVVHPAKIGDALINVCIEQISDIGRQSVSTFWIGKLVYAGAQELYKDPSMRLNPSSLFSVVDDVAIDHVAIQVAPGMMVAATTLFEKLGYAEDHESGIAGEWGNACFMLRYGAPAIQLTHSADARQLFTGENHLALKVGDAYGLANAIQMWLSSGGVTDCTIEQVADNKYFVTMPSIITISLELVSD